MGKARSLEAKLARLKVLRHERQSVEVIKELRAALAEGSNLVVAEAAQAVMEVNGTELAADLVAAFDRFLINPLKTDKLCKAKAAIAEALNRIEYNQIDLFRRGVRYVQFEPVWGGQQDMAGPLRAACAFALVRLDRTAALPVLADLLADPEKPVRTAAAQALANCTPSAAVPLLRLKARLGDKDAEVVAECFASLLHLDPIEAVPFVAEFFAADEAVCASAVLALGESRRPEAFEHLVQYWKRAGRTQLPNETALALALLRLPSATEFLLQLVEDRSGSPAAAVAALAVLRHDTPIRQRTDAAVTRTGSPELRRVFEQKFRD